MERTMDKSAEYERALTRRDVELADDGGESLEPPEHTVPRIPYDTAHRILRREARRFGALRKADVPPFTEAGDMAYGEALDALKDAATAYADLCAAYGHGCPVCGVAKWTDCECAR